MNLTKALLTGGVAVAFVFTGCKSSKEASGDKYLKAGDAMHALFQYEAASKGPVSKEYPKNYALANIQAMAIRAKEDPTAEFLDELKDHIAALLTQNPDPTNEALFVKTLQDIGMARIKIGSAEAEEGGFRFLTAAAALGGKNAEGSGQVNALKKDFVNKKLVEIQNEFKEAATTPTAGIVCDYKMNKLALIMGGESEEMKSLWSQIRKQNLNTYLMYDNDNVDLGERPDARINKYGVLLGIVKLEPGATTTKIQIKAFNGSSSPIHYDGDMFTLVDREGNVFKPTAKIGHFSNKDEIHKGDETKTGGLTFTYPAGTVPFYLEFKSEAGISRKYLP